MTKAGYRSITKLVVDDLRNSGVAALIFLALLKTSIGITTQIINKEPPTKEQVVRFTK